MNAVAKRLIPTRRRGFSQVRVTQAYLRSAEETEREKPPPGERIGRCSRYL
jgi:hypothetical protein